VQRDWDLKTPVFLFELDYDLLFQLRGTPPLYRPLPKFPSVTRDMALVVDVGLPVQRPMDFVADQHEPLLEQVEVFDLYQHVQLGKGKKSVGYRLVYRAPDRNLTDEEVTASMQVWYRRSAAFRPPCARLKTGMGRVHHGMGDRHRGLGEP
jgi:phenylalanyl-tRNA synthetase beta chain